jgi:RNA polymerase sigma-70 factor (ECF subfamily)
VRLVARAARGDRDARRELFDRHRDPAFRVALRITGNEQDALDVVQDSFIKAFESLAGFQQDAGFSTWFLRIVTNRALDLLRHRKVRLAVPLERDDGPLPPASLARNGQQPGANLERQETGARIQQAIDMLPPEQKSVFALYATGDLTYGQIAEIVGVPIGTVMSRIYHARRRLRDMLPDLAPEGADRSSQR